MPPDNNILKQYITMVWDAPRFPTNLEYWSVWLGRIVLADIDKASPDLSTRIPEIDNNLCRGSLTVIEGELGLLM